MPSPQPVYLHGHSAPVLRSHTWRTAQNSCPHLLPHLQPTNTILDVGCGPGTISIDLARRAPRGHITGIDISDAVVAQAARLAAEQGVANTTFQAADVYELPFADGSFDVVHAHQVLQHVDRPLAALSEMRRVCRPGGVVALREADAQVWFPDDEAAGAVLKEWYELWLRMARDAGGEPNFGRRLLALALQAGFARDDVQAGAGNWCFSTREELEWWCGTRADRVAGSEFAERAVKGGYKTQEELERLARAWREFPELEGAWFALLQGELVCRKGGNGGE